MGGGVGSGGLGGQEDRWNARIQLFSLSLSTMKAAGLLPRARRGETANRWGAGQQGPEGRNLHQRGRGVDNKPSSLFRVPKSQKLVVQLLPDPDPNVGRIVGYFSRNQEPKTGPCPQATGSLCRVPLVGGWMSGAQQRVCSWGGARHSGGCTPKLQMGDVSAECACPRCLLVLAPRTLAARPSHSRQETFRFPEDLTRPSPNAQLKRPHVPAHVQHKLTSPCAETPQL